MEGVWGKWVLRYRWWIIALTVVLVLGAAAGTRFLTFNNDLRVFFSREDPQLQALEALENTYNRIDNVLFVIAPKDGDVFTGETLAAIEELTEASWQIPYSNRVDSITNFQYTRAEGDELIVEPLVQNAADLTEADIRRIRAAALSEPLLVNRLVSPSGHAAGVSVNILLPRKSRDEVPEVAAFARRMADEFRARHPGTDVYLTGAIMFDNAFAEATRDDISTLVPVMFFAILLIIGLSLRSLAATFATLVVILFSVISGMGLAGWLGMSLNPASANAPTIILVLAVADSVHILVTMLRRMRAGMKQEDAVAESLRINLQPVFLTSATTAIGFLSMNFSDAPPFHDLGNIVAAGVTAALIYSVTFLPALMAVLPVRAGHAAAAEEEGRGLCMRLADLVVRRREFLFRAALIVIAVLTAGIMRLELNDDWIKYFDERYDIRKASDFTQENLSGFNIIEYSLDSGETGGINDPAYLSVVDKFAAWYRRQPKVVNVNTITDIFKRLNRNMHGDDESYYRIPENRELAAQYLLLYEMSLPFGLDLNNQINVDKSATRMIVTMRDSTTRELREMDDRARRWLKANAPEAIFTYGSGLSIIWAHISGRNINSMLGASIGALVLISGILMLALKSVRLGLLSLIPNLFPAFMAFGIWGAVEGQAGLSLSVIVAMTLGIVVDDTIHFMSKYLRARRETGADPPGAIRYSFDTVGTAMWVTTAALVGGFMVLSFSGFKLNSEMGLMTAITITLALLLDFLFLPVLLMKADREGKG